MSQLQTGKKKKETALNHLTLGVLNDYVRSYIPGNYLYRISYSNILQPTSLKMGLNTEHKLTLTEGQISIILCSLEDSINKSDYTRSEENQILQPFDSYCQEVDTIFEILEGSVDKYYQKVEKAQSKRPTEEW